MNGQPTHSTLSLIQPVLLTHTLLTTVKCLLLYSTISISTAVVANARFELSLGKDLESNCRFLVGVLSRNLARGTRKTANCFCLSHDRRCLAGIRSEHLPNIGTCLKHFSYAREWGIRLM
jgi:hypothetical protein